MSVFQQFPERKCSGVHCTKLLQVMKVLLCLSWYPPHPVLEIPFLNPTQTVWIPVLRPPSDISSGATTLAGRWGRLPDPCQTPNAAAAAAAASLHRHQPGAAAAQGLGLHRTTPRRPPKLTCQAGRAPKCLLTSCVRREGKSLQEIGEISI